MDDWLCQSHRCLPLAACSPGPPDRNGEQADGYGYG